MFCELAISKLSYNCHTVKNVVGYVVKSFVNLALVLSYYIISYIISGIYSAPITREPRPYVHYKSQPKIKNAEETAKINI